MPEKGLTADQARRELYEIMREDTPVEEKVQRALELGRTYLDVENAHLTRIHSEADYWEAVASTDPPDGDFPAGLLLDYQTTYCRRVLGSDDSIALHDATQQGWDGDPAVDEHGLHCYHGTPIYVDGDPYGTVCFVSEAPRETPFDQDDTLFAELVARLLEHELERQRHRAETTRRSNSITVLSRVLRHNLRNEMTVVRGHIGSLADRLDDDTHLSADLFDSIDRIIALSDKARKLETVVLTDYDRDLVTLEPLLDRVETAVGLDHPDATITIDVPEGLSADLKPSFELAVTELVENAAAHGGPGARVAVQAEETSGGVTLRVSDDGPGLPEQERAVLAEGVETPLVHGSGLGLWMVYWVVTTHDGTIDATVTDDGTTVTVRVPRVTSGRRQTTSDVPTLKQGVDRFEAVFEESFDSMVIVDDDRRIIDANDHAAALFDLSKSELLGRSLGEFAAPAFDTDDAWSTLQADGQFEGRFPVRRSDGTELVVEFSGTADILPGQHLLVGRDVTDRIERERELEQVNQRLTLALEGTKTGIWEWDLETDEVTWSESMERLFGLTPGTFEGTFDAVTDRIHPEDLPELEAAIETAIETDDPFEVEARIQRDDGEQIWGDARGEVFEGQDGHQRMIGIVTDVTERIEREHHLELAETVFENTQDALFLIDVGDDGEFHVERVNEVYETMTGLSNEEIVGRTPRAIVGDEVGASIEARYSECVERRETIQYLEEVPVDGEPRQWQTKLTPVVDDGSVEKLVGAMREVPE